jgi:hypothetical protein
MRAALFVDRVGPARKNDALGDELELRELLGARQHLREDIELTETASDPSHRGQSDFIMSVSLPGFAMTVVV